MSRRQFPTNAGFVHTILRDKTGKEFEDSVIFALKETFKNNKTYNIVNYTGTDQDIKEGTDFTCGGIRFDATTNFSEKNNMPWIMDTGLDATPFHNFQLGIRNHNNRKAFPAPVIVLGIDIDPYTYNIYSEYIENKLQEHAQELMYMANDCLDDYQITDPEERKDMDIQPILKQNPDYTQPRNLTENYKKIEAFRSKLSHFDNIEKSAQTKKELEYE